MTRAELLADVTKLIAKTRPVPYAWGFWRPLLGKHHVEEQALCLIGIVGCRKQQSPYLVCTVPRSFSGLTHRRGQLLLSHVLHKHGPDSRLLGQGFCRAHHQQSHPLRTQSKVSRFWLKAAGCAESRLFRSHQVIKQTLVSTATDMGETRLSYRFVVLEYLHFSVLCSPTHHPGKMTGPWLVSWNGSRG